MKGVRRMEKVTFLIHIKPGNHDDQFARKALLQMRKLLNICTCPLSLIKEEWEIQYNQAFLRIHRDSPELRKDAEKIKPGLAMLHEDLLLYSSEQWKQDTERILEQNPCRIMVSVPASDFMGKMAVTMNPVFIDSTIELSEQYKMPFDSNPVERRISGMIPRPLWEHMDQSEFIAAFQQTCITCNASYACIDRASIFGRIASIHQGWFRYHGVNKDEIDPETRLPGIQWSQYITESFVQGNGGLSRVLNEAPCAIIQPLGEGLWLQTSPHLWKCFPQKRLALRRYFTPSLYDIDLRQEMSKRNWGYSIDGTWDAPDLYMKYLPLDEHERSIVKEWETRREPSPVEVNLPSAEEVRNAYEMYSKKISKMISSLQKK